MAQLLLLLWANPGRFSGRACSPLSPALSALLPVTLVIISTPFTLLERPRRVGSGIQ